MVKITKIRLDKDLVLVTTDKYPLRSFGFKIDDVVNEADLKDKVSLRLAQIETEEEKERARKENVENLQNLIGQEI